MGKKKLLKNEQVVEFFWPEYSEFSLEQLLLRLPKDDPVFLYLPDPEDQKRKINRNYAYSIFSSLHKTEAQAILDHANSLRQVKSKKVTESEVPEEILDFLLDVPQESVSNTLSFKKTISFMLLTFADVLEEKKRQRIAGVHFKSATETAKSSS